MKNRNIIKSDKKGKNKESKYNIINIGRKNKCKNNVNNKINIGKNNKNKKINNKDKINLKSKRKDGKSKKKSEIKKPKIKQIKFNKKVNNKDINNNIMNQNDEKSENKKINKISGLSKILPEFNLRSNDKNNKNQAKFVKKIMEYNDDEMNDLPYNLALQYDKRTYCVYYFSLLKTKHTLIFSFFYNKDYNSKIIKMDLFFIGFTIYYTVNALFYNDSTMHNIYINNGSFDIEYKFPKIVYSSLISMLLNTLLKILALSNNAILNLKQNKENKNVNEKGESLKTKLNIKFALFFVISFILLLFFLYYLAMFCAIYRNTQYHLIEDTLISFGLSLIYPLGIYLIPGFFRIPSLSNHKNKKEYLYKLSKILQIF